MNVQKFTPIASAGEGRNIFSESVVRMRHSVSVFVLALGLGAAYVTVGLGQNNPQTCSRRGKGILSTAFSSRLSLRLESSVAPGSVSGSECLANLFARIAQELRIARSGSRTIRSVKGRNKQQAIK